MNTSDCLIHWRPQEFTDTLTGMTVTLSRAATCDLETRSLQRINISQLKWTVYDPVMKRELYTMIGDYTNG